MVDIETMGTKPYSAIISLAAVEFDIETGETGRSMYLNIDLKSCFKEGLIADADTIIWWFNQEDEARKVITSSTAYNLRDVLHSFNALCDDSYQIWANSPSFDLVLLANAYERVGLPIPWKYYNERDVRTLTSLAPEIKKQILFNGTKHNALADCFHQIIVCHSTYKKLFL